MGIEILRQHALEACDDSPIRAAAMLREAALTFAPPPAGARGSYAVRIMLTRGDSCEADTEPEADPEAKPTETVAGMRAITSWVVDVVRGFHAGRHDPAPALDPVALDGRLPGLRVSLSRAKGDTWWRVPYEVGGQQWIAAVHVVRM